MTDCNTGREKLDVVLSHMHGTELHRTRLLPLFIVYHYRLEAILSA